jgi:hypothetical protein
MRVTDLAKFIYARDQARLAKESGQPRPYTQDPIISQFRFCNMQREHDKVTKWIAENWRLPLAQLDDENIWFWMLLARLVNVPETLACLTDMVMSGVWDEELFMQTMRNRLDSGDKAWSAAYIVSTNGYALDKEVYVGKFVLTPAWERRLDFCPLLDEPMNLSLFCDKLRTLNGVSGFMAGQVIADAKYADPVLMQALDWHTFAVSGPGSRRGLNRVMDNNKDARWKEKKWYDVLQALRIETNDCLAMSFDCKHQYHAQDIQNCLCEFDKYERVRLGEGTPRQRY